MKIKKKKIITAIIIQNQIQPSFIPSRLCFHNPPNVGNWSHYICRPNWNLTGLVAIGGPLVPQLIIDMPTFYDYDDISGEMILDVDGNPQTNERVDLYWLLVTISAIILFLSELQPYLDTCLNQSR